MCVLDLNDCKTLKGVLVCILIEDSHDFSVSLQLSGGCELTVVLHDFSAGCSTELSVCTGEGEKKTLIAFIILFFLSYHANRSLIDTLLLPAGQTVELLERPSERPGWCLVRTTERSPPQEGLVPSSVLCVSHSRSSVEMDCFFNSGKGRKDKSLGCFLQEKV